MSDKMDSSRKLMCFGPCTEYGDLRPDGVARVRIDFKSRSVRSIIALDYAEALMLKAELDAAIARVQANRDAVARRTDVAPADAAQYPAT